MNTALKTAFLFTFIATCLATCQMAGILFHLSNSYLLTAIGIFIFIPICYNVMRAISFLLLIFAGWIASMFLSKN